MALSLARQEPRERLLSVYGQDVLSDADVAEVQDVFRHFEVESGVRAMAEQAHRQALSLAEAINFSDQGRADVLSLVDFLLERDH